MAERLERLRGALAIAREVPADIRREDAVSFLRGLELSEGHVTVVWHSIMWQYLSPDDRAAVDARLEELGAKADESTPLAQLRLELTRVPRPGRTSSASISRPGRAASAECSARADAARPGAGLGPARAERCHQGVGQLGRIDPLGIEIGVEDADVDPDALR